MRVRVPGEAADAKCNIGVNGTDQRGHACADGTYCCFCEEGWHHDKPCQATLGRENLTSHFGGGSGRQHTCRSWDPSYACYELAVFEKLAAAKGNDAFWYSSLEEGYCDAANATGPSCTWRVVSVDKIVSRACHTKVFGALVQATQPSACLDACGAQATNTSSPCWTDCFYKAAMGPDSGKAGGALAGMSLAELTHAWEAPFLPEEHGGCPALPQARSWFEPRRSMVEE